MSTLHPADQSVFLPHAGHFQISHVVVHPQFRWTDRLPVSDLAIVFLREPVPAISPMPLNTLGRVRPSTLAAAVGYGAHNPLDASGSITSTTSVVELTGLKLHADIETGACGLFERSRKLICWRYRTANRSGMTLGSTCRGDSGGPLYAISRGETYLVGVTSGGGPSCQPDPSSTVFDIEVFAYKDWIQRQLRTNPAPPGSWPASSPGRPASNGMKQAVCHFCPMCDQLTGSIKIPDNTRRVRVSVHCTPDDITRRSDIELRVSAEPDGTNLCVSQDPVWTKNPREPPCPAWWPSPSRGHSTSASTAGCCSNARLSRPRSISSIEGGLLGDDALYAMRSSARQRVSRPLMSFVVRRFSISFVMRTAPFVWTLCLMSPMVYFSAPSLVRTKMRIAM